MQSILQSCSTYLSGRLKIPQQDGQQQKKVLYCKYHQKLLKVGSGGGDHTYIYNYIYIYIYIHKV